MSISIENWIVEYLTEQQRGLKILAQQNASAIARLIETLQRTEQAGGQIFAIGNGGNAANASHFATDLGKGASDVWPRRFRIHSLNDNTPWMTALGNDYSYEEIFSRQLANFARPGDLLLVSSVSGDSPNLLKAVDWANAHGMETAAFVGSKRGRLAETAKQVIAIEDTHYGRVEDAQMTLYHLLCYVFMEGPLGKGD